MTALQLCFVLLLICVSLHSVSGALDYSCTCLAARADYLYRYPQIQSNGYLYDPIWHYNAVASQGQYTWNCNLCNNTLNAHFPEESTCNCPEARAQYAVDYPDYILWANDPYAHWTANYLTHGFRWTCEKCKPSYNNPSSTLTCNCTAARKEYQQTYPLVEGGGGDVWNHFSQVGQFSGYSWNCGICNDTCPGAYAPNQWAYSGQVLPQSSNITIPNGCYVPLSGSFNHTFDNLFIRGSLGCNNNLSAEITASKIWVNGNLECGTPSSLFNGSLTFTLSGTPPAVPQTDMEGGDKSIAVFNGGRISLHGKKQVSWDRLAATVQVGATQIQLINSVDWQVGDQIVIAKTGRWNVYNVPDSLAGNEVRTIVAIDSTHKVLTLNQSLAFKHVSIVESLSFGHQPNGPLKLNKQAEVGLLSKRNIRIQGTATPDGFGGHVILLFGAHGYASGVEFYQMGQKALLARYPWHWHMLGDIPAGQYIKNSSVHYSYNRCITIHGTNNTLVANNTCFNFIGHGYFLEDGVETGNLFDGNLGVFAIRPAANEAIIPSDIQEGHASFGPAVFWLSNPNNTLTNNVAVGGQGTGFWYQIENAASGKYASWAPFYNPQLLPFGPFTNNLAHSIKEGVTTCAKAAGTSGPQNYDQPWPFTGVYTYATFIGLWPCGAPQYYKDVIVAESMVGMQCPTYQNFENVAWVASFPTSDLLAANAINLYDSGWSMNNVLFMNYPDPTYFGLFYPVSGTDFNTATRVSNVTLVNSPVLYGDPANQTYTGTVGEWGHLVNDLDGSLTGHVGALTTSHPMVRDENCIRVGVGIGYNCPYHYAQIMLVFNQSGLPPSLMERFKISDPSAPRPSYTFTPFGGAYRLSGIVNTDYAYSLVMPNTNAIAQYITLAPFSHNGDSVAFKITNVKQVTGLVGATLLNSCSAVYQATTQSYFWDVSQYTLCVKLVARTQNPRFPGNPWAYYTQILLTATSANGETPPTQPTNQPTITPRPTYSPYDPPYECQCLSASFAYYCNYPPVRTYDYDALAHNGMGGGASLNGWQWDCTGCNEATAGPSALIYPENAEICNCTAAINAYLQRFGIYTGATAATAFIEWRDTLRFTTNVMAIWRCDLCPGAAALAQCTTPPPVTPTPTPSPTPTPTPSPGDLCISGVSISQTFVSSWESNGVTFSQWSLSLSTSSPLFDVKLFVDVPEYLQLNSLWGFFKESGSSLYALNAWQLPIPSATLNKSIAGYIIGQASALPITAVNARCESSIQTCQFNASLHLLSLSNSSCGLLSERRYQFSFSNNGTSSTTKAKIIVRFNAHSYPTELEGMSTEATPSEVVESGQAVFSFPSSSSPSLSPGGSASASFTLNVPQVNSALPGFLDDPSYVIISFNCHNF